MAGTFAAALLWGAGAAMAQDRYAGPYPTDDYYDRAPPSETVIVRPYNWIEKRQLVGRINGEINPVELSISTPVSFGDLDLRRDSDFRELHDRILDTARGLCAQLARHEPGLNDTDGNNECVRTATRNAMDDVLDRRG
jgi:UrcA family protein